MILDMTKKTGISGIFSVRLNGTCWLIPDGPRSPLLKLDPDSIGSAMPGDTIIATPLAPAAPSNRDWRFAPPVARISQILARKREWVVGVLRWQGRRAMIVPRDPLLAQPIPLKDSPQLVKRMTGRLIVARLAPSLALHQVVTAHFVEDLGHPDLAANDIPALLKDRGMTELFPAAVQKAAAQEHARFLRHGPRLRGREDLREQLIVTIDPTGAHDHDDAISIEALPRRRWKLGVHIADVAAVVPPNSPLDLEARKRGNSTYLVDRVIRMLPQELTLRVCSLRPDEDHLTHSVELIYSDQGRLLESRTFRSVIRTRAALTYEQVQAFFDSGHLAGAPAQVKKPLRQLQQLCRRIRAARIEHGALEFVVPEVQCRLDRQGNITSFVSRSASEAYQLIEECMLAANQAVARKIHAAQVPSLYRIHEEPAPDQWVRMGAELRALGIPTLPRNTQALNQISQSVSGQPLYPMITLAMMRNLQRAFYGVNSQAHFGLGFTHYTHFTSPIRRYSDLVIQRILVAIEDGRKTPLYSRAEIEKIAAACSATERESAEVESLSFQIKRARYFAARLKQGAVGPFAGTIVALNPKGAIVELSESQQQGMLPFAALGKARFRLAADGFMATTSQGRSLRLGQSIQVCLAAVDERLLRVDFCLPPATTASPAERRRTRPRQSPHLNQSVAPARSGIAPASASRTNRTKRRKPQ